VERAAARLALTAASGVDDRPSLGERRDQTHLLQGRSPGKRVTVLCCGVKKGLTRP